MAALGTADHFIRDRVSNGASYGEIASELQQFSSLGSRGIHRSSRLTLAEVDTAVEDAVARVGPSYGRRTLNGFLRSTGIIVGEQRFHDSMARVSPSYIDRRRTVSYRQLNPVPYHAQYHGHKLHLDRNEKLCRYGVTHVAASDGFSGKLLGIITIPIKNPIVTYEELYRPIVLEHGLWDQVRVDCGREFALILFVQQLLSAHRTNTSCGKPPCKDSELSHELTPRLCIALFLLYLFIHIT